nr:hypothetical protein [Tanacetum cinerariifolium]
MDVPKTKENHVVSKPVTLQTSPDKQKGANSNKNIIAPGMYKVVTTQESQTNKAKSGLSSTRMTDASSVRRLMNRDSYDKNSVLAISKNLAKKVAVLVVQIVLWIVDNGYSKHMTGDRSLLRNFIEKFMGTIRFRNDNFAAITGYGDYIQGNITICYVYYVEGLGHNLFNIGQFCNGGSESNLYTISISNMAATLLVCMMSKATLTKSWLWQRRLSHLNIGIINDLTRLGLVDGHPKFKYRKGHLCSACERGKSKKVSHPPKLVPSDNSTLELLHMDLCEPIRVASINGKKYVLVIVDSMYNDYIGVRPSIAIRTALAAQAPQVLQTPMTSTTTSTDTTPTLTGFILSN